MGLIEDEAVGLQALSSMMYKIYIPRAVLRFSTKVCYFTDSFRIPSESSEKKFQIRLICPAKKHFEQKISVKLPFLHQIVAGTVQVGKDLYLIDTNRNFGVV